MPKPKVIKHEGQIIQVPDERTPDIVEVSYTQAKKLVKKPMSDKQAMNVQKMVEMNRIKWEAQKQAKEKLFKEQQAQIEATTTKYVVKPKRIYPPREKQIKQAPKYAPEPIYEEDSDDESSDDEIQYTKPKPKPKLKHIEQKMERIKALDSQIKEIKQQPPPQQSQYAAMLSKFWK